MFSSELCNWYQNWLDKNKLPQLSADELLISNDVNEIPLLLENQKIIVEDFIIVWNKCEQYDESHDLNLCFKKWLSQENIEASSRLSHNQKRTITAFKNMMVLINL